MNGAANRSAALFDLTLVELKRRREKAHALKPAMMQELFTDKTRLV